MRKPLIRNILILLLLVLAIPVFVWAENPASSHYKLQGFGFGSGGKDDSSSENYRLNAVAGEQSGSKMSGTTYKVGPGLVNVQQADVPPAPTFTNADNNYNKLHFVINPGPNPSDALFALAVSTDNFVSDTRYVQNDNTIGASLGIEDYQTYTVWGGASGADLVGLNPSITYYLKAKAIHGDFTETGWGPPSNATTVAPSLSFDIDVSATDQETDPPFTVGFGNLVPATVNSSTNKVWIDLTTNAVGGGRVYVTGTNGGLTSAHTGHNIVPITGDLSAVSEGYGAQVASVAQESGGPLTANDLYDGTGGDVGQVDTTIREIYSTSGPINAGRASFQLKAKSSTVSPAASDYTDTFTLIASSSF